MGAQKGMLTQAELEQLVAAGDIDTVIVAFTDMQGRLTGKRVSARLFVDDVAEHGAECCNYLLATDLMMATPDELQAQIYRDELHGNMKQGAALAFAHGLNVHFNLIEPKSTVDVIMIAPKGPGHAAHGLGR